MTNELERRIGIGEMERLSKEKREKIASVRSRVIQLLDEKGKEKDGSSSPDLLPKYFDGTFSTETTKVRFLLQSDNTDVNQADKVSITFFAINETLSIDSDLKCDLKVVQVVAPGKETTNIEPATHYQIQQYSELLEGIEQKYLPAKQIESVNE